MLEDGYSLGDDEDRIGHSKRYAEKPYDIGVMQPTK